MQTNRLIRYCLCLMSAIVFLPSCYEDKGNYDYADMADIYISNIARNGLYRFFGEDTVTIRPTIFIKDLEKSTSEVPATEILPDNAAGYKFEWFLLGVGIDGKQYNQYKFAEVRNLEAYPLNLPSGSYKIFFRVTNPQGVSYSSNNFELKITSSIASGFIIMSNVAGQTRIDFLNWSDNQLVMMKDKLQGVSQLWGAPFGVSVTPDIYGLPGHLHGTMPPSMSPALDGYTIYLSTATGTHRIFYEDLSFKPEDDLIHSFMMSTGLPANFLPTATYSPQSNSSRGEAAVFDGNNNDIYYYNPMYAAIWNGMLPINSVGGTRFNSTPHMTMNSQAQGAIFYDADNKSFAYNIINGFAVDTYYYSQAELNNTGKNLVFINLRVGQQNVEAILRDNAGQLYFARFHHTSGINASIQPFNAPDSDKAMDFTSGQVTNDPFVYYRTDDNVYCIHTATFNVIKVYTAPMGHKISRIKVEKNSNLESISAGWINRLLIFTYDDTLPADECGTMSVYKSIDAHGNIELEQYNDEPMEWSGLGKVVDAAWKQK